MFKGLKGCFWLPVYWLLIPWKFRTVHTRTQVCNQANGFREVDLHPRSVIAPVLTPLKFRSEAISPRPFWIFSDLASTWVQSDFSGRRHVMSKRREGLMMCNSRSHATRPCITFLSLLDIGGGRDHWSQTNKFGLLYIGSGRVCRAALSGQRQGQVSTKTGFEFQTGLNAGAFRGDGNKRWVDVKNFSRPTVFQSGYSVLDGSLTTHHEHANAK